MDNTIGDQRTMKPDASSVDRSLGDGATLLRQGLGGQADDVSLGDARTVRPGVSGPAGRRFAEGERLLGRYRVIGELGQGGMGVVYRCHDETAGIDVALKALPPEVARSSGEMEEVRANFRLVERLHHPNIANAKTLERDPANGDCYLVMELVDGYDVRQWVRRRREEGRPLTLDEVTILAYRIAEALDYAHEQGVVHRDIKPSNVRVDFEGNVKVLDFGLAAQISTSQSRVSRAAAQGTGGTAPYMAPEQWRGRRQGAAADQYALAATVYELLEGAPPFEGPDPVILREAVLGETPAPVSGAPEHVNAALLRALSKEPEARFASCGAFVKALAAGEGSGFGVQGSGAGDRKPAAGAAAHAEARRRGGRKAALWLAGAAGVVTASILSYTTVRAHKAGRAADAQAKAAVQEAGRLEAEKRAADERAKQAEERAAGLSRDAEKAGRNRATLDSGRKMIPVEGLAWASPATGMEFVWVPALKVWVGKYEVTNGEYRKKVPDHDSKDYEGHTLNEERQPVVYVNFDDAKTYAAWLTERDWDVSGGARYRVIAEDEWQTCAQCGDGREYPWGNAMPPKLGNYSDSASAANGKIDGYTDRYAVACPVEKSGVNEWGIYGLGGNVWECCASDVSGSAFGAWRGASWSNHSRASLRSAYRNIFNDGSLRYHYRGFRLVLTPDVNTRLGMPTGSVAEENTAKSSLSNVANKDVAAITIACSKDALVLPLEVGQARKQNTQSYVTRVSPELTGWRFVTADGSDTSYEIDVNKDGVLYAFGGNRESTIADFLGTEEGKKWEDATGIIHGNHYGYFCVRRTVTAGDVIKLKNFRAQLAATSIELAHDPTRLTDSVPEPRAQSGRTWTNSLGMVFVPVPGTKVHFSIWDTRVQDYQAFVSATGRSWEEPGFTQGPTHPAVMIGWDDAKAFCTWLTERERRAGVLSPTQEYRLPTDLEWSAAVGIEDEIGHMPEDRRENGKKAAVYAWGSQWPPPRNVGNYGHKLNVDEFYKNTSPVGSFAANRFGLFDMSGNVWQWCEDRYRSGLGHRVLRGGSWVTSDSESLLLSFRRHDSVGHKQAISGFRCVLPGDEGFVAR